VPSTKHVDNNGPMKPLKVIKHAYQFEYNGGKWGLDKSTENYLKICVQASTSPESKYICRLFDGLVANSWIYDKSHFTIMPYVTQFREKHGRDPTREQIRQRAYENKLSDYVLSLSLDWLKALEDERRAMMNIGEEVGLRAQTSHSPTRLIRQNEKKILDIVKSRKDKNMWPITHNRALAFAKDEELRRLRLFSSALVKHDEKTHPKTVKNKRGVYTCALCSVSNKREALSRYGCSLCSVSLCTSKKYGLDTTCFEAWHSVDDLKLEHNTRKQAAESSAKNPKHSGSKKRKAAEQIDAPQDIALESADPIAHPESTAKRQKTSDDAQEEKSNDEGEGGVRKLTFKSTTKKSGNGVSSEEV